MILLSVSLVIVYNIKLLFIVQLFQQSISVGSNITMLKRAFLLNGIVRVVQLGFVSDIFRLKTVAQNNRAKTVK